MTERRISELVSGFEAPDVIISENNVVSGDRIKEMTMMKIKDNKSASHRGRLGRVALIAAVLAMVLGVSAGAYVGLVQHDDPAGVLEGFFDRKEYARGDRILEYETIEVDGEVYEKLKTNMPAWERMPLDEEVAEKYIYPYVYGVGESISYKDYTLTVEAVLYDANIQSGLLYYTVENPNGIDGYELGFDGELWWPTDSPYYTTLSHPERVYIDAQQTTDTKLYICSYFISVEEWGAFELRIGNGAERSRDEYEAMTIMLPENSLEALSFDGGNVVLTPLGMSVDKAALDLELASDIDHITIRFTDDSEYIVEQDDDEAYISNSAYALGNSDGSFSRKLFNSVVDIDAVVEVRIEDMIFKVK